MLFLWFPVDTVFGAEYEGACGAELSGAFNAKKKAARVCRLSKEADTFA